MAPDERPASSEPPHVVTPLIAWLLPPLGIIAALALAIAAGVGWQGTLAPAPPSIDLAPVATGSLPFAALAGARDGDWCALVTSAAPEPALQSYFVRREKGADGRDRILIETTLVNRGGHEWLADAIGATAISTIGFVTSESAVRTVSGRTFRCKVIVADLPARGAEEPARRTTVWVSSEAKSLGVVAARVELLGVRRSILEWELGGFGSRGSEGPAVEWGQAPLDLARSLTRRTSPPGR